MTCLNCKKEVHIPDYVLSNVRTYQKSAVTVSTCCGIAYTVRPLINFDIQIYRGNKTEDEWGEPIKKMK